MCVGTVWLAEDAAYTRGQIDRFYQALDALKRGDHYPALSHPEQLLGPQLPGVKMRLCTGWHRFIRGLESCRGTDDTNARIKTGAFPEVQSRSAAPVKPGESVGVQQSLCRGAGDAACRIVGRLCGRLSARTLVRERRRARLDRLTRLLWGGSAWTSSLWTSRIFQMCVSEARRSLIGAAGGEKIFALQLAGACGTITNELVLAGWERA